jgi:hypothetical protein
MSAEPAAPVYLPRGQDRFNQPQDVGIGFLSFKVTGPESQGGLLIAELAHHTAGGPPRHVHPQQDEWFSVVEGHYQIAMGDQLFDWDRVTPYSDHGKFRIPGPMSVVTRADWCLSFPRPGRWRTSCARWARRSRWRRKTHGSGSATVSNLWGRRFFQPNDRGVGWADLCPLLTLSGGSYRRCAIRSGWRAVGSVE